MSSLGRYHFHVLGELWKRHVNVMWDDEKLTPTSWTVGIIYSHFSHSEALLGRPHEMVTLLQFWESTYQYRKLSCNIMILLPPLYWPYFNLIRSVSLRFFYKGIRLLSLCVIIFFKRSDINQAAGSLWSAAHAAVCHRQRNEAGDLWDPWSQTSQMKATAHETLGNLWPSRPLTKKIRVLMVLISQNGSKGVMHGSVVPATLCAL